jgi:hypothetical protein
MKNSEKVILESVDEALSSINFVKKEEFYHTLKTDYQLDTADIPKKYDIFRKALADKYGINHHLIERKIVKVLHNHSKSGVYDQSQEIPAFTVMVESYVAEVDKAIKKSKNQIQKNKEALSKIKKNDQ